MANRNKNFNQTLAKEMQDFEFAQGYLLALIAHQTSLYKALGTSRLTIKIIIDMTYALALPGRWIEDGVWHRSRWLKTRGKKPAYVIGGRFVPKVGTVSYSGVQGAKCTIVTRDSWSRKMVLSVSLTQRMFSYWTRKNCEEHRFWTDRKM